LSLTARLGGAPKKSCKRREAALTGSLSVVCAIEIYFLKEAMALASSSFTSKTV
jgi:hypothetical protein